MKFVVEHAEGDKKTKALVVQWFQSQLKRSVAPEKVKHKKWPNQNKWVDADVGLGTAKQGVTGAEKNVTRSRRRKQMIVGERRRRRQSSVAS